MKRKGLAAPTVNDAIKTLRMPFKAAHDVGYIEKLLPRKRGKSLELMREREITVKFWSHSDHVRNRMSKLQTAAPAQKIDMVRSFLLRFDGFKRLEEQSVPLLGEFLDRFAVELPKLRDEEQSWQRKTAPNFNVFRALHLERRETIHSRFLAELLDPNGIHGQGDHFLTEFLHLATKGGLRSPSEWPEPTYGSRFWEITTEEAVKPVLKSNLVAREYDRLDIVIRCEEAKFIMVIENKINAEEGTEQLLRYYQWLQEQRRFKFRHLLFLTPDGGEPETISKDKCLCLSYQQHVTGWLRKLIHEIQAPHLRFAINQYLQLLDSF